MCYTIKWTLNECEQVLPSFENTTQTLDRKIMWLYLFNEHLTFSVQQMNSNRNKIIPRLISIPMQFNSYALKHDSERKTSISIAYFIPQKTVHTSPLFNRKRCVTVRIENFYYTSKLSAWSKLQIIAEHFWSKNYFRMCHLTKICVMEV